LEARVAKLEAAVEHIQRDIGEIKTDVRTIRDHASTDFRVLFGGDHRRCTRSRRNDGARLSLVLKLT
jgi:hypothetical protein